MTMNETLSALAMDLGNLEIREMSSSLTGTTVLIVETPADIPDPWDVAEWAAENERWTREVEERIASFVD